MDPIIEIAKKHNLPIIEDSCEALGSEYKGRKAGTLGKIGMFAFYPNKQITTAEGGILITDDENIAMLARSMRNQGKDEGDGWLNHSRLGYNYRLSELSAALGLVQMDRLEEIIAKRSHVADLYNNKLKNIEDVQIPFISANIKMSWFVYVIRLNIKKYNHIDRDNIIKELKINGIAGRDYFPSIHLQPFYVKMFGYKEGDYPISEGVSETTIALPFFSNLEESQIDHVSESLKKILKSYNVKQ